MPSLVDASSCARRALAIVAAAAMIVSTATVAHATTRAQISSAKHRLISLERTIAQERAHIDSTQIKMRVLASRLARNRVKYAQIQAKFLHTNHDLGALQDRFRSLKGSLNTAAADAYINGPVTGASVLFNASSIIDLEAEVGYLSVVMKTERDLAHDAHKAARELSVIEHQQKTLFKQRAAALEKVTSQENALTSDFAGTQSRLANLARARVEVGSLVVRLKKQLQAEELAAASAAVNGGTPISFGQWAGYLLRALGDPVNRNNLVAIVAWETAEYTDARWNPLATTYAMPGSTSFNYASVRSYRSLSDGLKATIRTLRVHGYGYQAILRSLTRGADPMKTGRAINASSWCHGCASGRYVIGLIPSVQQYYSRYASART